MVPSGGPLHFGVRFEPSACISLAVVYVINAVQTIGDLSSTTMGGIRMITSGKFTMRSSVVVGLSVALGVGITQVAGFLQGPGFPAWIHTVFGSSPIVVTAIMAIILNLTLPKDKDAPEEEKKEA